MESISQSIFICTQYTMAKTPCTVINRYNTCKINCRCRKLWSGCLVFKSSC